MAQTITIGLEAGALKTDGELLTIKGDRIKVACHQESLRERFTPAEATLLAYILSFKLRKEVAFAE